MTTPTATTPGYGTYDGKVACDCTIEWLPAFEAELRRCGILDPGERVRVFQLTGLGSKSGGTHGQGGAIDDDQMSDRAIWVARQMGADASFARLYNWDGKGGMAHAHRVLTGCPHNGPARYQIDAVVDGFNGLGRGGRGGPDTGPRPLSGRTWREGIAWSLRQHEETDMTPAESALLKKTAETTAALTTSLGKLAGDVKEIKTSVRQFRASERVNDLRVFRSLVAQGKSDDEILAKLEQLDEDRA